MMKKLLIIVAISSSLLLGNQQIENACQSAQREALRINDSQINKAIGDRDRAEKYRAFGKVIANCAHQTDFLIDFLQSFRDVVVREKESVTAFKEFKKIYNIKDD
jgi:hypothetical protein